MRQLRRILCILIGGGMFFLSRQMTGEAAFFIGVGGVILIMIVLCISIFGLIFEPIDLSGDQDWEE